MAKRKASGGPNSLASGLIDSQGRDEMNLAEFPISALTDFVPQDQNTIRYSDDSGSLMITGSDAYGLPTAADADVIVALIQLTRRRNTFKSATVPFSRSELVEILGWPESGNSYRRLTESLLRWSTTSLQYEGTWWDQNARRKMNAVFHILNEVVFFDRTESPQERGPGVISQSYFTWNKIFLTSCQAGNLKRLDVELYFGLKHATSKRLYRFLDKRLYRQGDQTFDLAEVAFERVGLSRSYVGRSGAMNAGKVKEKLQPAVDELEACGFLVPLGRDERYAKADGKWTVRFVRRGKALPRVEPDSEVGSAPERGKAVEALVVRNVTKATAEELVRRHPLAVVLEKLEVFDWNRAKDPKVMKTNPAGWLVRAIEDDYPAPPGFESRADREARQRREREAEEQTTRVRSAGRRRDRFDKAVDDQIARLEPDRRAALEAEALAGASEELRRGYESQATAPAIRKALLLGLLREHVGAGLQAREAAPA